MIEKTCQQNSFPLREFLYVARPCAFIVVEDDLKIALVYRQWLKQSGFAVDHSPTVKKAMCGSRDLL